MNKDRFEDIFNLPEGPVVFSAPRDISEESFEEMRVYVELFLKRLKRIIGK